MAKGSREFAIVDIETTGGSAAHSRITEVAIIIHDGVQEIHRWESLINPERPIPPAIFSLTGIHDDMVADAPLFSEVAPTIYELLKDRVFVAHNVNFDYSFLKHELAASGYPWQAAKLCTVRLARKLKPGLASYSLGRLCDALGISLANRHRAGGDASATVELFELLVAADEETVLQQLIKRNAVEQRLPPNLPPNTFDQLPLQAGVYYFHDRAGKVIYVGKANNIKKRVSGHFSGHNIEAKRQGFLKEIYDISFVLCGTELMSLLLECQEINRLWPKYNRALKRVEPKFGLVSYTGMDGYQHISLTKLQRHQPSLESYYSLREGAASLRNLITKFELDPRFCHFPTDISLPPSAESRLRRQVDLPELDEHNSRLAEALESLHLPADSYVIVDRGRDGAEKSCIWIERGRFYGMGYITDDSQLISWGDHKQHLTKYKGSAYMMQVIESFLQKPGHTHQIIPVDESDLELSVNNHPIELRMQLR